MDKIMSTRMDEKTIQYIGLLAKKLGTSKKAVLENAIRLYVRQIESDQGFDVLADTFGSWHRDETADEIVQSIKKTMRQSLERHKR